MQIDVRYTLVFTDFVDRKDDYSVLIMHIGNSGSFTKKNIVTASLLHKKGIESDATLASRVQTSIDFAYSQKTFFYVASISNLIDVLGISDDKPEKVFKLSGSQYRQLLADVGIYNQSI